MIHVPRFQALHSEVGVEFPARGGPTSTSSWTWLGADGREMLDAGELLQLALGLKAGDDVVEADRVGCSGRADARAPDLAAPARPPREGTNLHNGRALEEEVGCGADRG